MIEEQLKEWFKHLQKPNSIGNFPICPYAAKAIADKKVTIKSIENIDGIKNHIESVNTDEMDVTIFYLPQYENYNIEELRDLVFELNKEFNNLDKVILDNDPRTPFIVNGVQTSFDGCYLMIIQGLKDLTKHSNILKSTDYYSYWTKEQLDEVVTWRENQK